ncbi:MAG: hypothetical protein LBC02_01955 [Planctomycetaceae bacterium]|jgi:hypothetical protein|nr:hypothetical protein [Planctomycetaceae bacterium]
MKSIDDLGSDPRWVTGPPSVKAKLYKRYNAALEKDAPIDPVLDNLLFGGDDEDTGFDLALLKQVTQVKQGDARPGGGACSPASVGAVNSIPPTKHVPKNSVGCLPVCMGGYDGGFESGFIGEWNSELFRMLTERLELNRQSGMVNIIEIGGREFAIKPYGSGGGDLVHYRYVIEGGGWKVYIHHCIDTGFQPIRVRFGFESLCGRSLYDVHNEFMLWLCRLGFRVSEEKISRVDLQVMTTRPVSAYVSAVASKSVVMRAREGNFFFDSYKPSSFNFGTKIRIRCYDKKRQLLETCDEFGMKMISEYCCGGVIPDNLTRIEYQVNREALEVLDINTIHDLRDCELSLVEWLTFDWFRLLDSPAKKGHTREQKVSEIWQEVRNEFCKYFPGGNNNRSISRNSNEIKDLGCTSDDLLKQAVGCLATAVSRQKGIALDDEFIMDYVVDRIREFSDDLLKKAVERSKKFSVQNGYGKIDDRGSKSFDPSLTIDSSCISDAKKRFTEDL